MLVARAEAPLVSDGIDAAMAELDMDRYDEEDAEAEGVRGVFGNTNPGMAYYGANEEDPYIQLAAVEDADSEAEDYQIRGDDYILLAARNEDDVSHLEVKDFSRLPFCSLLTNVNYFQICMESGSKV